jgi:hypothetical protein
MLMQDDPDFAEWAGSPVMARRIAARLAGVLAGASQNDRVDSVWKIAERFSTSRSVAENARNLLTGRRIIYKSGRHYYIA